MVAIRDCKLSYISRVAFVSCLTRGIPKPTAILSSPVSRLREADKAMAAASFLTVKARVARALLELAERSRSLETESGRIVILHRIRQSDIAAMCGRCARKRKSNPDRTGRSGGLIGQSSCFHVSDKRKLQRETEDIV